MARIYKESRYVLQLLIGKSYGAQYEDIKISFYTKNPSNQVMVDNDITIKRNIAEVKIESTLFDNLEDGLIKYIVYGTKDDIPFIEERISNYFLKTPLDFKPSDKPIPPQNGWGMTGYFNNWGGTPDIPFEEDGEWDGRPYKVIRGFEAVQGEFKIRRNNAWTNSYTASFGNIPQFAKLIKGDINIKIDDGVWDIYLFFGDDGAPNEMLILHPGTDLSTIQYEYTLKVSVDKENAIIEIGDGFDKSAERYYGGTATIPMKCGCIYSINVLMEGYEDIYDEITCYNDEERTYTLTKIKYNTIADIYSSPNNSTVTFKGLVALSLKYGNKNHILLTDHTGSIALKNYQEPLSVGDECLVTATLRRDDVTYISTLYNAYVEVLSSNNYVVMPTDAIELTNLDGLYIPNEDGYAEMKYLYADGTVVVAPSSNFMRIETGQGNIGLRGDFSDWETKLAEGDNIRVYMFTQNSPDVFFVTDIIKLGAEGGSCNLINPIVFSKEAGNTINAENVQIPTFVYEGNQYYNVDSFNLADIEEFKIHILFKPDKSGDGEPINVFGCEDADWDDTTFGARIHQGQIYFRMSGEDVASPYTENAWYDVEMGYNTTKRWVIVNGETLLETEHTSFNRPRQTLMIGAFNSGGNAFRPFYGKIAAIYIKSNANQIWLLPKEDGTMNVYWNNLINSWNSISGNNNARFENDYISGDGMKSITWLGNLEDKWVTPSMSERDGNGYIVVSPSEGYNGLKRTVINPQTIYNEGLEAGRAEGGEGGSCNLGELDWTLTEPNGREKNASDDGYDGYSRVIVRPENIIAQEKENAINDFKNNMSEITITENGIYSIDDTELTHSISFDGNSYFDTGIVPTENIKIEVCIKVTNGNDSQMGGIIIGGGIDPVNNDTENRGIAIGMDRGAIYGKWGAIKSWNNPYDYVKTTTVVLQKTDDSWRWDTEKGSFGASTLYIGGYNRNGEEVEEKFTQSIVYIKIWTNKDDDSTMTLFRPKNMAQGGFGMVNSEGTEYNYVENLGEGTATFVEEFVNKYPNGFKRVEVNVPNTLENIQKQPISIDDYNALIGNYDPNVLYLIY